MIRFFITKLNHYYDTLFPEPDPDIELVYFDTLSISRSIRDTMSENAMKFTDTRLTEDEFDEIRSALPFGKLPIAYVGDETIAQSKTILRFVSRYCKTYPSKDILNQANCDQWIELHTEFMNPIHMNMYPNKFGLSFTEKEKMTHRTKFIVQEHIPKYFEWLNDRLMSDEWLCTETKSAADYCWLPTLQWLYNGMLDGIDSSVFEDFPEILSYLKRSYEITFEDSDVEESTGQNAETDDETN